MKAKKHQSVWDAIESDREVAANMKARSELMIALQERLGRLKGTQAERAEDLGVTQPRLNDLLKGRIDKFSLDALVNLASRAGLQVDLHVRRAA
jgi:predicted XRE-type DNA-binding protein